MNEKMSKTESKIGDMRGDGSMRGNGKGNH